MVSDLASARELCRLNAREEALLASPRRPIVLARRRAGDGGSPMMPEVAPGCADLGVMLPYTPLHELLLEEVGRPVVMTSGNRTDEPIAYRDEDARERLDGIADLFLVHDRPIRTRCDDSVARVVCGGEMPVRRSRGYVPEPVALPEGLAGSPPALALGGHLKNTFCLTRDREAFPGPHVGDLENLEAYEALRDGVAHFSRLFEVRPEVVAHDPHPDYLSTRLAGELAKEIGARAVGVQHHHAHVAACAAEHGITDPVIGVAFDGTGYGTDGAVWGGEVLVADLTEFRRAAHLAYVPLPGGDAAVRQPWRMALAHLVAGEREGGEGLLETGVARRLARDVGEERWQLVEEMVRREVGSPPTSSVGRLFDAVAALAGLRSEVEFQAQAAMELEARAAAAGGRDAPYPTGVSRGAEGGLRWDAAPMIRSVVADLEGGADARRLAARFHRTVASSVVELCRAVRRAEGISGVALTGGVFQNALLTEWTVPALEAEGFEVLLHRRVPPNDGGLSYGQAAVALARADRRVVAADGDSNPNLSAILGGNGRGGDPTAR
jgi:hydrogenase maturation protein HypF